MNRSMVAVAVGLILVAFGLITFPLWALGTEEFDAEQEAGILFLPFGLAIMLVALTAPDPTSTTIGGAFGNPEFDAAAPAGERGPQRRRLAYDPREPVGCPHCRTFVAPELAQCPRCARARPCRSCGRSLGLVLDRPTCPPCGQAEPLCNCPSLARKGPRTPHERVRSRWR
jgi:hypothetical protein